MMNLINLSNTFMDNYISLKKEKVWNLKVFDRTHFELQQINFLEL